MATIKELLQNFCYRMNIPAPSAFVGVNAPNERQLLSLFQFVGDNLRNRPYNWPQLKRPYTFTTQTDVRDYQLPGDFYRILESTQWDETNNWPMRGPISDFNFAVREFAVVSLQTRKAYRLIGSVNYLYNTSPYSQRSQGWLEIDPAGQNDTDQLFMGYISCNWIWPRDWVTATPYVTGDIRSGNGYVYIAATDGTSGSVRPNWSSGTQDDGTPNVSWTTYTEPYLCNPGNAALNDDDICLFDEDLMLEGMRWAWLRAKQLDYQQERADWEMAVRGAASRFNGPQRINVCDDMGDNFEWPNIPPGDWNV